jgi:hypothetical protein
MFCAALLTCGEGISEPSGSYLCQPAYCLDHVLRCPTEPYVPQAGDIMLTTDEIWLFKITFNLAGTGHPHHSGIAFVRSDGRMAILESGPHDTLHVETIDVVPHLRSYEEVGRVWIRKRRHPLNCEQSARLTAFAEAQEKKRFAGLRLVGQMTPLRSRGPLRTCFMGGPHGERRGYFCSELVLEACVASGLLDPATTRPAATYPRDLFFDASVNLYINRHLNLAPDWYPPARWLSHPCTEPCAAAPAQNNSSIGVP